MVDGSRRALKRIGRGRSAVVYRDPSNPTPTVHKVFVGERLSKLVLFLLTGSANPYTWCQSAIEAACARRHVLGGLVRFWFADRLRLPHLHGWDWNAERRAHELQIEFIEGGHVPLRAPVEAADSKHLRELTHSIMRPLQRHLAEAGFDGSVWQAGKGNPVAAGNFMRECGEGGEPRWVWIDVESGVPALFALNPLSTLTFYLPKSLHHRRWLFDDVDVDRLRTYVERNASELSEILGANAMCELARQIEALATAQGAWHTLARYQRSIAYERSQGRLRDSEAHWYESRPLRWYLRLAATAFPRAARRVGELAGRLWRRLQRLNIGLLLWRCGLYFASARYRAHVAGLFVRRRLRAWSKRRQMTREQAGVIRQQLRQDESGAYITDFSVHLAIKPAVKFVQYGVVPLLLISGVLNLAIASIILAFGGALARSLYTLWRCLQAAARGRPLPWVALLVGLLPMAGNAAFPAQLLYSSSQRTGLLARFIILDLFAAAGRAIPIWGGPDSLLEHRTNRLGGVLIDVLMSLRRRRAKEHQAQVVIESKPAFVEPGEQPHVVVRGERHPTEAPQ
ncbi:MAG: hypothetical protein ACF8NJ_01150 [Phycisphaerales bacterium JB038]